MLNWLRNSSGLYDAACPVIITISMLVALAGVSVPSGCGRSPEKIVVPEKPAPLPDPSKRLVHGSDANALTPGNQPKQSHP